MTFEIRNQYIAYGCVVQYIQIVYKSNNKSNSPRKAQKKENPARMTMVKLSLKIKILRGITLYIGSGAYGFWDSRSLWFFQAKRQQNMARMIKIKLSLKIKISREITLYFEQGRLDLETLEVLKVLKQQTTSWKTM